MKNLKFIIAVVGISLATLSSFNANAKKNVDTEVRCEGDCGYCGVSVGGCPLAGQAKTI